MVTGYPPIGARGFAPQKICEPIMPIRCTSTMFKIIDLAVDRVIGLGLENGLETYIISALNDTTQFVEYTIKKYLTIIFP